MAIKSENLSDLNFPNWKIHSRSVNFNRRIDEEVEVRPIWKSWANAITENTSNLETFVKREGQKEIDIFYKKWKYPFIGSNESLKKIYHKTKSIWTDRIYILVENLESFHTSPTPKSSTIFEILSLDETTRLNLYSNQSLLSEMKKPTSWNKSIERAMLSFKRRSINELGRHFDKWELCYRRIRKGFIGNKYGDWDIRYRIINEMLKEKTKELR
ncbi:hypothetical protein [Leptospira levettii]|uniref:Transposase n=1 Tax=Leptospira levettii TaxID=2023178 RepID=A0AAW5VB20_9LEPT|nr:hypothetical protein [Leptospira levettii]MCW7467894.1 hypothetical protein [Leptospira levettii]MCW7513509.1 hypothetical protein [Leptospira levettii]MCW7515500.1 hypothetical protein [Leptospira levettii]